MDTYTVLRDSSDGNLTIDETLTFTLGPMVRPLYLHTNVPEVSTDDTLLVNVEFKHSSTVDLTTYGATISAVGHYVIPIFCDDPDITTLSVTLNVTGASVDFGTVEVWLSTSRIS